MNRLTQSLTAVGVTTALAACGSMQEVEPAKPRIEYRTTTNKLAVPPNIARVVENNHKTLEAGYTTGTLRSATMLLRTCIVVQPAGSDAIYTVVNPFEMGTHGLKKDNGIEQLAGYSSSGNTFVYGHKLLFHQEKGLRQEDVHPEGVKQVEYSFEKDNVYVEAQLDYQKGLGPEDSNYVVSGSSVVVGQAEPVPAHKSDFQAYSHSLDVQRLCAERVMRSGAMGATGSHQDALTN